MPRANSKRNGFKQWQIRCY